MRKVFVFFLFILFSNDCFPQWALKDTVELQARNHLPNFFHKINSSKSVNIGFLGGSITNADGWRPKITDWIKRSYELDNIYTHNAAINGTNSKYGVFRIERQLLSKADFDLIFIEFAVNDGSGNSPDVEKSMEGIVRKIWKHNPYTDICFVYTTNRTSLAACENGKMNLSATKHDSISSYYEIPSVFWTEQVYNMIQTDTVVWYDKIENTDTNQNSSGQYVFTTDNLHPSDFGHEVYKSVLAKCIDIMKVSVDRKRHILKPPVFYDNYENVSMLSFNEPDNHGFEIIDSKDELSYLNKFIPDSKFLVSSDLSSNYCFSFFGNQLGLNIILGPTGGYYIIEVDGTRHEFKTFDTESSYYRRSSAFFKTEETGVHFVKIYPSSKELTLSDKREILNSEIRKKDLDNNPSKYDKNELIFSDIFLDGQLNNNNYETLDICSGESIHWQNRELREEGTYYAIDTILNGFETKLLELKVYPTYYFEFNDTISNGDSIEWEGAFYKETGEYLHQYYSINGCDSILNFNLFVSESGQFPKNPEDNIVVYPNPCIDIVKVSIGDTKNKQCHISITDIFGKVFFNETQSCDNEIQINTKTFPSGIYFIIINDEKARKLIKINPDP